MVQGKNRDTAIENRGGWGDREGRTDTYTTTLCKLDGERVAAV